MNTPSSNREQVLVVIPARYGSQRLEGKPILAEVRKRTGKYLIQHVYERTLRAETVAEVVVATDDMRIYRAVQEFGGQAEMTSAAHTSGTDRVAEVVLRRDCQVVVNVQGDEPEISPGHIDAVVRLLREDEDAVMGTLAHAISDLAAYRNPACVKVVVDRNGNALYFSRSPLPYLRDDAQAWLRDGQRRLLRHMGIYSYRRDFLVRFAAMKPSALEQAEKLEQLRALEAGYRIKVAVTDTPCVGIDTPEDLQRWLQGFPRTGRDMP